MESLSQKGQSLGIGGDGTLLWRVSSQTQFVQEAKSRIEILTNP